MKLVWVTFVSMSLGSFWADSAFGMAQPPKDNNKDCERSTYLEPNQQFVCPQLQKFIDWLRNEIVYQLDRHVSRQGKQ